MRANGLSRARFLSLKFRASTAQAHASSPMQRKEIPSTQCRISPHWETRLQASSPQRTSSSNLSGNQYLAYLRAVANHFFFGMRRLRPKLGECLRSGLVPRPPFGVETASSTVHWEELDARNSRCLNLCTGTPVSLASSVIVNLRPR